MLSLLGSHTNKEVLSCSAFHTKLVDPTPDPTYRPSDPSDAQRIAVAFPQYSGQEVVATKCRDTR